MHVILNPTADPAFRWGAEQEYEAERGRTVEFPVAGPYS